LKKNASTGPYEHFFPELESMGFTRDQIKASIKSLQDNGKKVHQESLLEKLVE